MCSKDHISERIEQLADIASLTRTPIRFRILELLCASSCSRTELRHQLDIHRTTLRKNLLELETRNWIEDVPTENVYRALPAGRIVAQSIRETLTDVRTADRLGESLALLPEAPPIRTQTLRACTVTRCDTQSPYAPIQRLCTLVGETETVRAFTPAFNSMHAASFKNRISGGYTFEIIGPQTFIETLQCDYPSVLNTESVRLLVSEDLPRFGVALLDDVSVIAAYDHDMRIHSLLEVCDEQRALVEWAEQQYDAQRKVADEYEPPKEEDATPR